MRTLLVMRHAKSDWGAPHASDHDRPLARRGIKAARRIGHFLAVSGAAPELVLSSTAVRAVTTIELAAKAGDWDCEIVTSEDLYGNDPGRVLERIGQIDHRIETLLIAGHEPTWSTLVNLLIGGGRVRMPTAAVASLDLPHGGWVDLAPSSCELRWLITPKMLKVK